MNKYYKDVLIGNVTITGNIMLAPLAGVSDMSYRVLCKENGASLTCTEMVSAKSIVYKNKGTLQLLEIEKGENPVAVQLFGSDASIISEAIKQIDETSFDIIDINMGCPVPKVFNNGEGSALMKNPKLIGEIVSAAVKSTKKPITIKIRAGINDDLINAVEVAKTAEQSGVSAVAVHGRTREQYYSGLANLKVIQEVKKAVCIPVFGNGDVFDGESAVKMFEITNCDAIMIGRAAEGNPWVFNEIAQFLQTGNKIEKPLIDLKIEVIKKHLDAIVAQKGEYIGIREMRKHIGWYVKGIYGAAELRQKINNAQTKNEIIEMIECLRI